MGLEVRYKWRREDVQIVLHPDELPKKWYNILPDLLEPLPRPKDPETGPSRVEPLPKMMVNKCLEQEFSEQRI